MELPPTIAVNGGRDLAWRLALALLASAAATLAFSHPAYAHHASVEPKNPAVSHAAHWSLIFRDEFNGSRINRRKWSTLRGAAPGYGAPFNRAIEAAAYSRRNVAQRKGVAVLTLRRGSARGHRRYPYSSGLLHNGRNFSFAYGYVEARVKVPRCSGCWPAFWMLEGPPDSAWPPEIDIFEYFNTARKKRPYFNFHWKQFGRHRQHGIKIYGEPGKSYVGGWHTYGLLWTPHSIQTFIDGESGPTYDNRSRIPSKPNYLIFNLALQRGHKPRSGRKMLIDSVRVWQARPE